MSDVTVAQLGSRSEDVARYYDSNSWRFLLVGSGRRAHAMHRELWGPGVASAHEASDFINRVIGDEIAAAFTDLETPLRAGLHIADLGCGVGGTLFHLAGRFPGSRLHGITLSARQVETAQRLAAELGLEELCSFMLGDFQSSDLAPSADVAVAVESFAHSTSVDAFFASAARRLRTGGRLMVADDFLAGDEHMLRPDQRARVAQLRAGWRVPAICPAASMVAAAARHGFEAEKTVDFTALTRPGRRVRDRLIAALSPVLVRLGLTRIPFYGNMIGGHAVQVGMREGFLRYQLVVLRRLA